MGTSPLLVKGCDTGLRFSRSHPKDCPFTTHMSMWRTFSNPDPHGFANVYVLVLAKSWNVRAGTFDLPGYKATVLASELPPPVTLYLVYGEIVLCIFEMHEKSGDTVRG
jgi:hypothetical protein